MISVTSWELADMRAEFNQTLTTACSINRKATDPDGLSTGQTTVKVASTFCAVSLLGGSGNSILTDTLLRAIRVQQPGTRVLSFAWDEDVLSGDVIITAGGKYKLGMVEPDDPMRIGIQVQAEIVTVA